MADTRGVFRLKLAGSLKSKGEWVPLPAVWHGTPAKRFTDGATETPNAGYVGGGLNYPTQLSTTDKINFSNDTAAALPGGNLTAARYDIGGVSSFTVGYLGGGTNPGGGGVNTMEKLTFSLDTTSAAPAINLPESTKGMDGIGNQPLNAGYFAGGGPSDSSKSYFFKLTFATETITKLPSSTQLTAARYGMAASQSPSSAYFAGGIGSGTYRTMVDKLSYSDDTVSRIPGADLTRTRFAVMGHGTTTAGYIGGYSSSSTDKLTFSSETTSVLPSSANFSVPSRQKYAATGNSSAGYLSGGNPITNYTEKFVYSSESQSYIPAANLSSARYDVAGVGGRQFGLTFDQPPTPSPSTTVFKTSPRTGYFGGGKSPSTPYMSAMNKMDFTTDAMSLVPGAKLTIGRRALFAASSKTAGYFTGGDYPNRSSFDKLTYSTDTTAALPSDADLSAARYGGAGVGNEDKGYFGGGYGSSPGMSTMDKITYSNDTSTYVPGANLSVANMNLAAAGNKDVGYFAGGYNPSGARTTLDKTTYASDTTAYTPTGNLSGTRYHHAGAANLSAAYFSGGISGSPFYSNTDKITFSNDTKAAVPGADLPLAKARMGATADRTASYYVGGTPSSDGNARDTNVSKMTFSTETMEALPSSSDIGTETDLMAGVAARQVEIGTPNIV